MRLLGRSGAAFWVLLLGVLGCVAPRSGDRTARTAIPPQSAQDRQAIEKFEQSRVLAELHSARACLSRGDLKGCQRRLDRLRLRDPDRPEVRQLQAELLAAAGQSPEAGLSAGASENLSQGPTLCLRVPETRSEGTTVSFRLATGATAP